MTVESWRVAQIVVDRGPGEGSRGSGYLVAPGLVLTAAHVVAEAQVVRVRLDVGHPAEVDVLAEGWWADLEGSNGTDLGMVMIAAGATAGRDVEPTRFGRVGDTTAVLAVRALGFPRFKLRANPADQGGLRVFRDLEQLTGHAPVAANRRQGTLAVYLDDPAPAAPEPRGPSPWAGMSGAAVWAADRIVGVVAEHHPGEGTGRLTARRIDRAYGQLPEPALGRLVGWLGLAPAIGGLPDVVPAGPGELVQSDYLEQVRYIAPDQLIGRDSQLAEWAEFCAGPDAYAWWQAGPWAGKTALASWFVTHPPAGVDIVSFFITRRLPGQADSDAFLDAMIEQLAALDPAGEGSPVATRARVGTWLRLLKTAADQSRQRARRLVIVVDGLDEDDAGATSQGERPSIASLLPPRPPPGVRVIVTSRADPGLPEDVDDDHPLGTSIHRLPVSPVAQDLEKRAKQELRNQLTGDQTGIDVIGYIAGSGGGLTGSDLEALTGAPPLRLEPILRGVSGRSLQTRPSADSRDAGADPATQVYLFAHDTLQVTAEKQLGAQLARYRQGIHDWIGSYASSGWPDATPGYAIRGYPGLLTATSDATRLSALARDPRRHVFLLRATGSDYAALAEIRTAQSLIAGQSMPDLQALVELAVYRHAISIRNQSIPDGLPAVWYELGRCDHAEALALTITDPRTRARALAELARAAAQAGEVDRAEALARAITDRRAKAKTLTEVARAAAQAGEVDRAEAIARAITDRRAKAKTLTEVARAAAQAGEVDRAEAIARAITDRRAKAETLTEVARAAAQAGEMDRASRLAADAEAIARAITDPGAQAWALAELASVAARAGEVDRASRLAADAEAIARAITDPGAQAETLTEVARAAAQAGEMDRASRLAADAEAIARAITDPDDQAETLIEVARAAAQAGEMDRGEALARTITDPYDQARALAELASVAAQAGEMDRASRLAADAEAIARTITNPGAKARALAQVARAAAQAGEMDRASRLAADAEAIARTITDPGAQAWALAQVAFAAAQAGEVDRAEALVRAITDPGTGARALAELASVAAQAGEVDRAEALARAITDRRAQAETLAEVARAAAQAGEVDRAEAIARAITDRRAQAETLAEVARAAAQAGEVDRAEALARAITDRRAQARALAELASVAAQGGEVDRASRLAADAEAIARAITDRRAQARALAELASVAAQGGEVDRASRLAADAEAIARAITNPDTQAETLTELARAAAQAGEMDRTEHLLALALTVESPEIRWWTDGVWQFFPSAIGGAADVFLSAYRTERDDRPSRPGSSRATG